MNAQKVAAHFFAFTYFLNQESDPVLEHAGRYARRHWREFLACASDDLVEFFGESCEEPPGRRVEKRQFATAN